MPALGIEAPGGRRQISADASGLAIELPDSGLWRTVTAFIAAFNSGDAEQIRRFFAEHAETGGWKTFATFMQISAGYAPAEVKLNCW